MPTAEKLRQLAETEQRSEAEIVRDALDAYVPRTRKLPTGAGKYHSGHSNSAEQAENILRKAAKEGEIP